MKKEKGRQRVHFIAIGGAIMHNLAIILKKKGFIVSGSDDEIFEPSRSRLAEHKILPSEAGWDPDKIDCDIDFVILGMHARKDNPELLRAIEFGIRIYSYPEYIYEMTRNKTRAVISGSHGKTTITSMIMHTLNYHNYMFDYLVGAKIEGMDFMVGLSDDSEAAILEGDEYFSSPLDPAPKFFHYHPDIALISGIAWDHINVYPTFEEYTDQFRAFVGKIEPGGVLIYNADDILLRSIVKESGNDIKAIPYSVHPYENDEGTINLLYKKEKIPVMIFGEHNMQNINGARLVCSQLGINDSQYYQAISTFKGAAKRLQLIGSNDNTSIYSDFAHSPSKLEATVRAVKTHYPNRTLVACMELHTFSSLNKNFLGNYKGTMDLADVPIVYYNPDTLIHKRLDMLSEDEVRTAFGSKGLMVVTEPGVLVGELVSMDWKDRNLLMMSSGNFSGIDINELAVKILNM
jgi:UDP-N-acetylmuramate: L-alanyl-gamma-D-glutamyl-meso-diaminopimelate ligase